ncbi:MAG: DUF4189 domain-containing protein [Bdellovibrio sp.]
MKKLIIALIISFSSSFAFAWGSIAYDRYTGRYGMSWNWGTQAQANSVALQYCGTANCYVIVSRAYAWLALSTGKTNNYWYGASWSSNRYQALYQALLYCNNYGNVACKSTTDFYTR